MRNRTFTGAGLLLLASLLLAPGTRADQPIRLDARLAHGIMKGDEGQRNYLRIGLKGCRPEPNRDRTPVNVAFVIDRSGSMAGQALEQARAAAIMAVHRLGPADIASVVTFDHAAQLLVDAQRVTDRDVFIDRVARIAVGGTTAIHAGVVLGAIEVGKFKASGRLNRVILLSDGQANVGPRRPAEFASLGAALFAEGISVTTIGLGAGYNEDLMLELARSSDGNHAFAREPSDLITIFNKEFDDVLGSCAQTVSIDIDLVPGVRVVRSLSREGSIDGQRATFRLNQLYAGTEHYLLLELELDQAVTAVGERELGIVKVGYALSHTPSRQTIDTAVRAGFSASDDQVRAGRDPKVEEAVLEQVTRQRAQQAVKLQDAGKASEARQLLMQNATELQSFLASAPVAPAHLIELTKQYRVLAAPKAASAGQGLSERKILRELQISGAGSATRY
jgi:Ca-activated chloride channel homolog